MLKHNTAELLAKYLLRSGRGGGLVNHVTDLPRDVLEGTVYLFALKGLLGVEIPAAYLIIIVLIKKVVEYSIGWLDECVGFWKIENEYASRNINPFNQELLRRIKIIEDCVCKTENKGEIQWQQS